MEREPEYLVVKCYACGQEVRGARIIRIVAGSEQASELEAIDSKIKSSVKPYLVGMLMIITGFIPLLIGMSLNNLAVGIPGAVVLLLGAVVAIVTLWKRAAWQEKRRNLSREHYGLQGDEWNYEIIKEK